MYTDAACLKDLQKEPGPSRHLASILYPNPWRKGMTGGPKGEVSLLDQGFITPSSLRGPEGSLTEVVVILGLADLLVHMTLSCRL